MYLLDLDKDNLGNETDSADKDTMYGRIQNIKDKVLSKTNTAKASWANDSKFTILQGSMSEDLSKKPELTLNKTGEKVDYRKLSVNQLDKAISIAVKNEDYELAAHLRDEINKRK